MISYGKQSIDQDDIDAVVKVLQGPWLTQGPQVALFEEKLSTYFGSKYTCAVSNGTAALHLTGLVLKWSSDDIIITAPNTFLASSNSIIYSGATPDFVDIDPNTYTIDLNKLEDKIKTLRKNGSNVKAVIGVDYAGNPCDWKSLREISDKYQLQLVNDNCHALGAEYFNDKKYAIKYADIVTQSYHPVKHITTGEGGAIFTNNKDIDRKLKLLRTHGITKNLDKNSSEPWYYEMHELGFNYRITDFQCALGINQIKKLDTFVKARKSIAKKYNEKFKDIDYLTIPTTEEHATHSYHLYPLLIDFEKISIDKIAFFNKMKERGINLQVHYIPIHLQPYYSKNYKYSIGDFPESEKFYKKEISLPIYPSLTNVEVATIIKTIKEVLTSK